MIMVTIDKLKKNWKTILLWAISFGIIVFGIYLFSPGEKSYTKSIHGFYKDDGVTDKVTIYMEGLFKKENHLWNTDMEFVGEISVEFEENVDMNFKLANETLHLENTRNGRFWYYTFVPWFKEEPKDCVYSLTLIKEWGNESFVITLDENWESAETLLETEGVRTIEGGYICAPAANEEEFIAIFNKRYE